jgi:4a-hydroxytetrahydrobiopterin dehydratase
MSMSLAEENCTPIRTGTPPLSAAEARALAGEVAGWTLRETTLERRFEFAGFAQAIGFVNRVAEIAQTEDHHPDMLISYNKVRLELSTHKIGGLTRNDFILAAKVDAL